MATFFVSDVHLSEDRQGIVETFLSFLKGNIGTADTLYILGDLFDLWLGDDDTRPPHVSVTNALRRLTERGASVGVLHGNHDFLLGKTFEKQTGCRLLSDPSIVGLYGERVLITHGDTLCTDDVGYQNYRKNVRNPLFQRLFRCLPLGQRLKWAASIRNTSREAVRGKPAHAMDVNREAVERMMLTYQARYLVHGHTHRPAIHKVSLPNGTGARIVLGDWYRKDSNTVLVWEGGGFRLITV
uniref:UDP-2,3-diacylglucosamine hydrolase n=1 Tax=Candidatus Kentrum sp. FW TaxID=2126338 RepID=A0A450T0L0_9GAMM|nr:MAG: UDP-2,3-diacylglucosamine hydrolase [Candidatus Kentron sp. FW]